MNSGVNAVPERRRKPIWVVSVAAVVLVPAGVVAQPAAPDHRPAPLGLPDLTRLALENSPRLRRAALAVDAAQGRAVQAGLYPNPTASVSGDELGSRLSPGGVVTAPLVSQEIVTGGKLALSRAAATREVEQAALELLNERFVLLTTVRQGYYEVLVAQRRVELLGELVKLATQSVEATTALLKAEQVAKLDVLQLRVELNRFRAEQEAAEQEWAAAFRRLAANLGVPNLPVSPVAGTLEAAVPEYDYEKARQVVLAVHPQLRSAQVGVARAQVLLRRAQAEPVPNVTVGAGYVRHNKDREDDWVFTVGVPVPLWNRNQGNIRASRAGVGQAVQQVDQTANELTAQLATAFGSYAAASKRVARYRDSILPDARETYRLSLDAFKGGQFEYLRVLQAQRAVGEANLEYNRALGEAWRAAGEVAGLLLEEDWPTRKPPPPDPAERPPGPGHRQWPQQSGGGAAPTAGWRP